jgi:hypothetical protein
VDHNGCVEERRWINHYQPQTLVMGTMLCYLQAVFGFLFGVISWSVILSILSLIALAAGGYGIANDKRWGYSLAVGAAVLQILLVIGVALDVGLELGILLALVFDGALVALLLHRESREYQRIWFS